MKDEHGYSLLELLTGLLLAAAVCCLSLTAGKTFAVFFQHLAEAENRYDLQEKIREVLEHGFRENAARYGIAGFRFHENGVITDVLGSPIPHHFSHPGLSPDPNSTATTFISLNKDFFYSRAPGGAAGNLWCYHSFSHPRLNIPEKPVSFLAIGIDGYLQVEGTLTELSSDNSNKHNLANRGESPDCPAVHIRLALATIAMIGNIRESFPGKSSYTLTETFCDSLLASSIVLLPIDELYSLYVDGEHTLRKLSHTPSGSQPLAYGLESLRLKRTVLPTGLHIIQAEVRPAGSSGIGSESLSFPDPHWPEHSFLDAVL